MGTKGGDQRGTSAIEFAIILPVLLVVLFGIVEFSIIFYDKAVITNASREGARAGIVYRYPTRVTEGEIVQVVNDYCQDYLITFSGSPSLTVSGDTTGLSAGNPLTVTVTYQYDFLVLPNFIASLTGGINLVATTVMRME